VQAEFCFPFGCSLNLWLHSLCFQNWKTKIFCNTEDLHYPSLPESQHSIIQFKHKRALTYKDRRMYFPNHKLTFCTYRNWKSHTPKSWSCKQNACFISYRDFQTQEFINGTQHFSPSSWKKPRLSEHMYYFLLGKWYYSRSTTTAAFIATALASTGSS